jgi:hypothetical protein
MRDGRRNGGRLIHELPLPRWGIVLHGKRAQLVTGWACMELAIGREPTPATYVYLRLCMGSSQQVALLPNHLLLDAGHGCACLFLSLGNQVIREGLCRLQLAWIRHRPPWPLLPPPGQGVPAGAGHTDRIGFPAPDMAGQKSLAFWPKQGSCLSA